MLAQIKRLGADSLLYAFMNVGTKLIAFIMLPIYTRFLSPAEYGVVDYFDKLTAMLTFLVIFGTDSALSYYYFDAEKKDKRLTYVRNVMYFRLAIVLVLFLLALIAGPWLANVLAQDPARAPQYLKLFYISTGMLFFDTVVVVVLMVLRFDFKTIKVVAFTVGKMLLVAILSYVILKYYATSAEGIFYGRLVSYALVFVLLLSTSWKYLKPEIDKAVMKDIFQYAAPLVPASLAFWVIASSSTFFLAEFQTLQEVGIYGAATKLAMIITLVTSGVQMAWRPYSMSIKDKPDSPALFAKIYMGLLLLGIIGIMGVATIMPYIISVLEKDYFASYKYVALLSAATFLNFFYLIISVGLFFTKKTKVISYTFGIVALVNLVLNVVLIPIFSIWGAVAAYVVGYLVAIFFIFKKSQEVYYVPVSMKKMAFLFLSALAAVISIIYIQETAISDWMIVASWVALLIVVLISRIDKDFRKRTK